MLNFSKLSKLDEFQGFLQSRSKDFNIFLVGGCVRDCLLGIEKGLLDIDFTMGGTPKKLVKNFDTKGMNVFSTEKFGTTTMIDGKRKYELTPLRTEGGYEDYRHPGVINRSSSLIDDAQRRDFTINAMYYFSFTKKKITNLDFTPVTKKIDEEVLLKILAREGYIYLAEENLLILRKIDYINQVFPEAKFDEVMCRYLIETQRDGYIFVGQNQNLPDTPLLLGGQAEEILDKSIGLSPGQRGNDKLKKERGGGQAQFRILIDPTSGLDDIVRKRLQTVGEPDKRFQEDALRIIRALRLVNVMNSVILNESKLYINGQNGLCPSGGEQKFQCQKQFDYSVETRESVIRNAHLLKNVAKERLKDEITKAFVEGDPFNFIVLVKASGMISFLFPSLAKTIGVEQPVRYHAFDVYTHTMLALKAIQEINNDYLVRLSVLYHDIGKVAQYKAYNKACGDKDKIREISSGPLNHRNSGPELMKDDFRKLGFSNKEIDTIERYIAEHHTPGEILTADERNREKKLRHLLSEKGYEMVDNLLDINIADRTGQLNPLQSSGDLTNSYKLKKILKKLNEEEGQFRMSNLLVNGSDLIGKYRMKPGPMVGELLNALLEWVLNDLEGRNNKKEQEVFVKNRLKNKETVSGVSSEPTIKGDAIDGDYLNVMR